MGGTLNYDYVLELAARLAPTAQPKILDFGCGRGQVVAAGIAQGLNIHGADTFEGIYNNWINECDDSLRGKLHKITDNALPFEDNSFDLIISNQVFEHIPDYRKPLREIHRVLKPGGKLIALFPVKETWYEGHVGLYFPHHLAPWPKVQYNYMYYAKRMGFGFRKDGISPEEWARTRQDVLRSSCFYHSVGEFMNDVRTVWKAEPENYMADYMKWRIGKSKKLAPLREFLEQGWLKPLLETVCLRRGGTIVAVTKA